MRFILFFILSTCYLSINYAYADKIGVFFFDMSSATYGDDDKSDIVLKKEASFSLSGFEYVSFQRGDNTRKGFEVRQTTFKSSETENIIFNYSTTELLLKYGGAYYGGRKGGIAWVFKGLAGYSLNEFYFENTKEKRTSKKIEQNLEDINLENLTVALDASIETVDSPFYFEFGLRQYLSNFEFEYLEGSKGTISYIPLNNFMLYATFGGQWR